MKSRVLIGFAVLVSLLVLSSTQFAVSYAPRLWRSFRMEVPAEVTASPGDMVTVNGSIYNTGLWWLHSFNLTLSGLPFDYMITPDYFENARILRAWDSEQGVYILPENFALVIKVPEDATGPYFVNITGQEHQSWRQVSNSTVFVLKILPPPTKFSITDLVIPENVTEFKPFNITFVVNNEGSAKGTIIIATNVTDDWDVSEKVKTMEIEANSSLPAVLTITPTNNSGQISIFAEYPFKETIIHITKVGPLLIPMPKQVTPTTVPIGPIIPPKIILPIVGITVPINRTTIVLGTIVILGLFILWKILSTYQFKVKRGKPEEMKKQVETPTNSNIEPSTNNTTEI